MEVFYQAAQAAVSLHHVHMCAIFDFERGICLARAGMENNSCIAQGCNTTAQWFRTQVRMMRELSISDTIEDMVITIGSRYHILRVTSPTNGMPSLFLYLIVERTNSNRFLAKRILGEVEWLLFSTSRGENLEIPLSRVHPGEVYVS